MNCSECFARIPDGSNYCSNCGVDLQSTTVHDCPTAETQWERCEIEWHNDTGFFAALRNHYTGYFYAKAVGKNGVYSAGKSKRFNLHFFKFRSEEPEISRILNQLIQDLVKDGWEPTGVGSGNNWFRYRFRRRIE